MSAHTEEQRVFIVRRLAMFDTYSEIVAAFAVRWKDTACTPQDVEALDPSRSQLGEIHFAIFTARRAELLADNAIAAPTNDKAVRIFEYHKMFKLARDRNSLELAAEMLEHIRVEIEGPGKGLGASVPGAAGDEVVAITRTFVDPLPQ